MSPFCAEPKGPKIRPIFFHNLQKFLKLFLKATTIILLVLFFKKKKKVATYYAIFVLCLKHLIYFLIFLFLIRFSCVWFSLDGSIQRYMQSIHFGARILVCTLYSLISMSMHDKFSAMLFFFFHFYVVDRFFLFILFFLSMKYCE